MVGWHHQLNGHEFEQILRGSEGQGSLVYCNPLGRLTFLLETHRTAPRTLALSAREH